jgi:hypothetical protein
MTFDLYFNAKPMAHGLTLGAVAEICNLDAAEIAWAIEECGRCDALDLSCRELTVLPHGDKQLEDVP